MTGRGPDLSYAQGNIDLAAILAAKPAFAGIRASYGTAGADDHFVRNREGLSGKVPLLLLYHFAYARLNPNPVREADTFCDAVGALRPGEAADLDWEEPFSGDHQVWVEGWWTRVEQRLNITRPQEWMYGSDGTLAGLAGDLNDANRHLWLAWYPNGGGDPNNPPAPPRGFSAVDIWQHGSGMWAGQQTDDNFVYSLGANVQPEPTPATSSAPTRRRTMIVIRVPGPDTHGAGAEYVTDGIVKRYLATSDEAQALATLLGEGAHDVDQYFADRIPEVLSVGAPGSVVVNLNDIHTGATT